jgi:hypothetical protein
VKTTVVNIRNHPDWKTEGGVYIGRAVPRRGLKKSMFANPYKEGLDGDRDEVILQYRQWFYRQLPVSAFRRAVEQLRGKMLVCWCAPERCHGDVIREYLDETAE